MIGKGIAFLPEYKVEVNGLTQTGLIRERLIDIKIDFSAGGESDSLNITLDDSNAMQRLHVPITNNDTIKVSLGYKGNMQDMGTFIVDNVSLRGGAGSADTYSIGAKAIDTAGNIFDKKYKIWKVDNGKIQLGSIISKIASDNKLKPSVDKTLETIMSEREIQRRESDISFLRFLADKYSAVVKFYDKTLIFVSKNSKSVSGIPIPPKLIFPQNIIDWNVTFGNRWSFKKFIAEWWDQKEAVLKRETATNSKAKNSKEYIVKRIYNSADEAKKAANAEMQNLKARSNKLSINILGDPAVRPFTPIIIAGVRTHVDGTWRAGNVSHSFSKSGYSTSLSDMSQL